MPLPAPDPAAPAPRRAARLPPAPDAAKRTLALEAHARLCAEYDCPVGYFHALPPLDELVSSLLSHRTKNRDSARAFASLRAAFPDWAAVRDAPVAAVEQAIAGVTWPEAKAPALQRTLRAITERRGALDLSHLDGMPEAEAAEWLASLVTRR